jgi:hypothetical protein
MSKYSPWFIRYALKYKPDEKITSDGKLYLVRWHIIKSRFLNIYLHRFVGPDKRIMHDHPWASLSYMLDGFFIENFKKTPASREEVRVVVRGKWTYRNSRMLHHLTPSVRYGAWTLFLTGPKFKHWGFLMKNGAMKSLQALYPLKRKENV